jgi:hypothetical protein
MSIKIVSEISKQYLLREDAIEGFKIAVENGQTRLALQVLVDIIDGMMEIFDYAMEEVTEDDDIIEVPVIEIPVAVSAPVQEVIEVVEDKKVSPKKTTEVKEEIKQTEQ